MVEPVAIENLRSFLVPLWEYRTQNFLFFLVCAWYLWNQYQMRKDLKELREKRLGGSSTGREPMAARN